MKTECINLRERWGDRYRLAFDESYDHVGVPRDKLDPWMMLLEGKRSVIRPWGGDLLAVEVDNRPPTAKALAALPGVRLVQDGDHEKTFVFPVELFEQVAALVKPRRIRQVSEEERQRLARLSQQHSPFRRSISESVPEAVPGVIDAQIDPEAV